jgi:predicted RNase H-like HicB family nuclease
MADGITIEEVTQNINTIMCEWIECAIEDGEAIPETRGKLMYA